MTLVKDLVGISGEEKKSDNTFFNLLLSIPFNCLKSITYIGFLWCTENPSNSRKELSETFPYLWGAKPNGILLTVWHEELRWTKGF